MLKRPKNIDKKPFITHFFNQVYEALYIKLSDVNSHREAFK